MFSLYFLSLRYIKLLLYLRLLLGNTFDIIRLLVKMLYTFSLFQFFKEQNKFFSGAKRDRTVNLRLARAALSQLSYSP